jgi:electron transfer flavoprotein alpha subunit
MSGILVIAEHRRGALADVSLECVAAAAGLRDRVGGPVRVLVVAADPMPLAQALNLAGVDEVVCTPSGAAEFDPMLIEEAAAALIGETAPRLVLLGHTADGMVVAPALAVRLGLGFAADVFELDADPQGLRVLRGSYGGKVNVELRFPGRACAVVTVRAQTFRALSAAGTAVARSREPAGPGRYEHLGFDEPAASGVDIGKAEFILSIGRGIQDEKNVARFAALAEKMGATLGCSRPVADSGWLPKAHQVGLTGRIAASCRLYLALGISGAVQHLYGMKHVDTIVAVNTDADAPIFNVATLGAAVDVLELAEALERLLDEGADAGGAMGASHEPAN